MSGKLTGCGMRDARCGMRDTGCGMRDMGYGMRDMGYGGLSILSLSKDTIRNLTFVSWFLSRISRIKTKKPPFRPYLISITIPLTSVLFVPFSTRYAYTPAGNSPPLYIPFHETGLSFV